MLNLKQPPNTQDSTNGFALGTIPRRTVSDIAFASNRFLGNIGAPLRGPEDDDELEDIEHESIIPEDEGSLNSDNPRPNDVIHA